MTRGRHVTARVIRNLQKKIVKKITFSDFRDQLKPLI